MVTYICVAAATAVISVLFTVLICKMSKKESAKVVNNDEIVSEDIESKNNSEEDISLIERTKELEKIAYYDSITGLLNMSKFSIDCKAAMDRMPGA